MIIRLSHARPYKFLKTQSTTNYSISQSITLTTTKLLFRQKSNRQPHLTPLHQNIAIKFINSNHNIYCLRPKSSHPQKTNSSAIQSSSKTQPFSLSLSAFFYALFFHELRILIQSLQYIIMYSRMQDETEIRGRRLVLQTQEGLFSYFNFQFLQYITMYNRVEEEQQARDRRLVHQIEEELFTYLQLSYETYDIPVSNNEAIHTVLVRSKSKKNCSRHFFVGHGFGGTSIMNFAVIQPLLNKGNVIFWQTRGMGFCKKQTKYAENSVQQIEEYFLSTIRVLLNHFKPQNSTFICHSFSSYLLLLFVTRQPELAKKHISQLILLSTIGVTSKQQDRKNSIRGCGDVLQSLLNKFGWAFKLTYKSPLRTICSCCKDSILRKHIQAIDINDKQKQLTSKIINTLILLPDGSEQLFFNYFQPRVLPKVALQPLIVSQPVVSVNLVYGGEEDWVDKSGAMKLAERFPEKVKFMRLEQCGHHIPTSTKDCMKLFEDLIK